MISPPVKVNEMPCLGYAHSLMLTECSALNVSTHKCQKYVPFNISHCTFHMEHYTITSPFFGTVSTFYLET